MTRDDLSASPAPLHPMNPHRGKNPSPIFAAFLCPLPGLEPTTRRAITGISVSGCCVLAATTDAPVFNTRLDTVSHFRRNLHDRGEVCGTDPGTIDALLAKRGRTDA